MFSFSLLDRIKGNISESCGTLRKMELFKKVIFISKRIQSQCGKVTLLEIHTEEVC